jgi:hypothetical protein
MSCVFFDGIDFLPENFMCAVTGFLGHPDIGALVPRRKLYGSEMDHARLTGSNARTDCRTDAPRPLGDGS